MQTFADSSASCGEPPSSPRHGPSSDDPLDVLDGRAGGEGAEPTLPERTLPGARDARRDGQVEHEGEARAFAQRRLDFQRAAHRLHELLTDRESQTRARERVLAAAGALAKRIEQGG